jgi:hypothetical protein
MGSSLVKFANRLDGRGRGKLYWGRVEVDGLPFRGPTAPTFTEEEFEDRVTRVSDPQNGTFRTWIPKENKKYLDVLDMIFNGWAVGIFQKRWLARVKIQGCVTQRMVVYIEWAEFFLEDGSRAPIGYGQPLEHGHGQTNGPFPPLPYPSGGM